MLDSKIRPLIDPPLDKMARFIVTKGISANRLTLAGLILCVPLFYALYTQNYMPALVLVALNRLTDGLDGPVARHSAKGATNFGGYCDIVSDFVFYSGFVFFYTLGAPDHALYGAFLLFSFFGSATSFLTYAVMAEKNGLQTQQQGRKSFFYMAGLAEGSETIIAFILICLFPVYFPAIAVIFGIMCWLTALGRAYSAYREFN